MTDLAFAERPAALDAFGALAPQAPDALLGLIALYRDDSRAEKIDLGVGVFRDDAGLTAVMRAVKAAEAILLREQETKSYLGPEGDIGYAELLANVALGRELARSPRIVGVQTPGGTGALRLGAELLRRALPGARIWIGSPTWPNHAPIFQEAGLQPRAHRFYDVASAQFDLAAMLEDLKAAAEGDVLLLHGCCHNPTGASLSTEQWQSITDFCAVKGVIPFIDLAYQGLGDGLDEDAWASRALFEALPNALLAYSCDKNFGLYRERVGALWVQSAYAEQSEPVRGNMLALARSIWSMPPDHGAAIVRTILERDDLRNDWMAELAEMRDRINMLRQLVAQSHPGLAFIGAQRGMFAMLPIDKDAVISLRAEQAIYMAGNARINIAGLSEQNMSNFVAGLAPHL